MKSRAFGPTSYSELLAISLLLPETGPSLTQSPTLCAGLPTATPQACGYKFSIPANPAFEYKFRGVNDHILGMAALGSPTISNKTSNDSPIINEYIYESISMNRSPTISNTTSNDSPITKQYIYEF